MEKNFTNENFEQFLQQNTEGLRMRASAKVWKNISSRLNRRRRRIGFILGASLLLTSALGYYLINESSNDPKTTNSHPGQNQEQNVNQLSADKQDLTAQRTPNNNKNQHLPFSNAVANNVPNSIIGNNVNPLNVDMASLDKQPVEEFSFTPTVVDSYFQNEINQPTASEIQKVDAANPLTIESVINSFKQKRSKLGWLAYFTPTVSYRTLSDNNIAYVTPHKPNFGFELGLAAKYPITKNIKARAGIQFNVNRYEIRTNNSFTELATIKLTDRNGVDTFKTATNFNNFSGYKISWLENFYFQVSAPVGVEIKLTGNDKTQFGIATTVQPTYLLSDRSYLISSDYKNYAEVPGLVRRWNVNSSIETFVTYSTGQLKWQVGPQVRYQLLSSYLKKYPVKENLLDFGFKVGISINNQ